MVDGSGLNSAVYDNLPGVLIFADEAAARRRAEAAARAAGCRVMAALRVADAAERLKMQISCDAMVIDISTNNDAAVRLLDTIDIMAASGFCAGVVTMPHALLDLVAARVTHPAIRILCSPDTVELAAAIGGLTLSAPQRLHDVTVESDTRQLQQLSEEVARIARALAALSEGSAERANDRRLRDREQGYRGEPAVKRTTAKAVRSAIRMRRLRDRFFDSDLFADPAWDMLLDLMAARLERIPVAVSSLCIASAVPPTTALRWIRTMTDSGLFLRKADPSDGRRVFIELSPEAEDAMHRYFAAVAQAKGEPA